MRNFSKLGFLQAAAMILIISLLVGSCGKAQQESGSVSGLSSVQTVSSETGVHTDEDGVSEGVSTESDEEESLLENSSAVESAPESNQPETSEPASKETSSSQEPAGKETLASKPVQSVSGGSSKGPASPAASGGLQVIGNQLCDSQGNPVQLRGVSTHGLAWYPDYVNKDCFQELRQKWQANAVRLAMYTAEYGGYCNGGDQEGLKALIRKGVSLAAETGLYVIVDWHILSDGNPNSHLAEAKSFFAEMAAEFSGYSHVLYEICNEPNGGVSWSQIKSYAQEVVPVIRAEDPNAVILVGTPTWSQEVDKAAADPITGYDNLMYTLHFYAATHTDALRSTMTQAAEGGLPIFVSEYGICDASGNGAINETQANLWVQEMDRLGISYMAWNLSNKGETSSLLKSGCTKSNGFGQEDLSASGQWLYRLLTGGSASPSQESSAPTEPSSLPTENSSPTSSAIAESSSLPTEDSSSISSVPDEPDPSIQGSVEISWSTIVENSWEAEEKTFRLYRLSIQNTSADPCESWEITLDLGEPATLSDSWCGNFSVSGNKLTITPLEYNAAIPAGGSVDNVGFIVILGK